MSARRQLQRKLPKKKKLPKRQQNKKSWKWEDGSRKLNLLTSSFQQLTNQLMAITASDVNKLRQVTGAGMMDCKKALEASGGDFEAAIDYLRKKGQKVAANR